MLYDDLDADYDHFRINTENLSSDFLSWSNFDNLWWSSWNNNNPCSWENEYLPTFEDWKGLMEIWWELNWYELYNGSRWEYDNDNNEYMGYEYYYDDWLPDTKFQNDMLIPFAWYVVNWYCLNDDTQQNEECIQFWNSSYYLWTSLGWDDYVWLKYNQWLWKNNKEMWKFWQEENGDDTAQPVRCFLKIEEPETLPTYTVSFVVNWWSSINDKEVEEWYKLISSELVPTRDWYTFIGWYVDESLTTPYNFDDVIEDDITLYAKWEKITIVPTTSDWWWARLRKDRCPGGDYSDSCYDGKCGASSRDDIDNRRNEKKENERKENQHSSSVVTRESPYQRWEDLEYDIEKYNAKYSYEMNEAYQYSYYYWITTRESIEKANMDWNLTRAAMAKMLSQYAINVLWMEPDKTRQKVFKDVTTKMDADYDNWITLSYQLWIMWINMWENFRPNDLVTRWQFVTALSRMKYGTPDGKDIYYSTHMNLLQYLWIIKNADPKMLEKRWYVMLMLMRSGDE